MTSSPLSQLEEICKRIKYEKDYVELCLKGAESIKQNVDQILTNGNVGSSNSSQVCCIQY